MSKKKNKKFKKSSTASQPSISMPRESTPEKQPSTLQAHTQISNTTLKNNDPYAISILNEKYLHVRKDVNKLLIVLLILAIVLMGIYFIGLKTNILTVVGDWLYKIGNFAI